MYDGKDVIKAKFGSIHQLVNLKLTLKSFYIKYSIDKSTPDFVIELKDFQILSPISSDLFFDFNESKTCSQNHTIQKALKKLVSLYNYEYSIYQLLSCYPFVLDENESLQ